MDEEKFDRAVKIIDDAYKTVRMGTYAIDCIMDKIEDKNLENLMHKQNKYYLESTKSIEALAKKYNHELSDINCMAKGMSGASINMKTMFNKENSHIAEMLIEGTTMGITTLIKERNGNDDLDNDLLGVVDKIIEYLEEFVESLKEFL